MADGKSLELQSKEDNNIVVQISFYSSSSNVSYCCFNPLNRFGDAQLGLCKAPHVQNF